jgi:site-specific recombinase XerD
MIDETHMASSITILEAKEKFLESIKSRRSANTLNVYSNSLDAFSNMMKDRNLDANSFPAGNLNEELLENFVEHLNRFSPSTESLYLQVIKNFFEFLNAEHLSNLNVARVRLIIRKRTRRLKTILSEYPEQEMRLLIDKIFDLANNPGSVSDNSDNLIFLRDKRDSALILLLADAGLRVDEVCRLRIGDINWTDKRVLIGGRGGKREIARISGRAIEALEGYLELRNKFESGSSQERLSLPLFARHDKGAGKRIEPITTTSVRNIVQDRVNQFLGENMVGVITPHTFHHYFVTSIMRATGNLKLAQLLARHSNIQVTQRYAHLSDHELDKGYYEIFGKKD